MMAAGLSLVSASVLERIQIQCPSVLTIAAARLTWQSKMVMSASAGTATRQKHLMSKSVTRSVRRTRLAESSMDVAMLGGTRFTNSQRLIPNCARPKALPQAMLATPIITGAGMMSRAVEHAWTIAVGLGTLVLEGTHSRSFNMVPRGGVADLQVTHPHTQAKATSVHGRTTNAVEKELRHPRSEESRQ